MPHRGTALLQLAFFLFSATVGAAPSFAQSITLQGRVTNSSGQPITGSATVFRVQIVTPNANACILYDESQTLNLSSSEGLFSLSLNNGTGVVNSPTTYTLEQSISNFMGFSVSSAYCQSGSGTVTYSPAATDNRKVIIQFKDPGTMSAFESIPAMDLNPHAYAMEARTVGGFPSSSLLRVVDGTTLGSPATLTSANFTELLNLINGTSANYMSSSSSSTGARLPTYSGSPTTPASGSMWYDTSSGTVKFFNGSATETLGTGSGSGTITGVTTSAPLSGSGSSGSVNISLSNSGVTAGSYGGSAAVPVLTVDAFGRVTAASTATISGVAPGGTAGGDLSGSYPSPTVAKLQGVAVSATAPSSGQVMKYNGTNWSGALLSMSDIYASDSTPVITNAACTSTQSLYLDSVTGHFECQSIGALSASAITTGTLAAGVMPAFTGDATSSAGSTSLTLAASGATAGTYKSVTVDAKGRVLAGTNPTTLGGFGITDGVQNTGGLPSMGAGADASKPTAGTAGRLFVASDTFKIYRDNGTSWDLIASAAGSGGTITNVTAGMGLSGGGSSGAVTVSMPNVGAVGTYTKVVTDAEGRVSSGGTLTASDIPALPWSQITSGTPTTLSGYGITNGVANAGAAISIQAGAAASIPAAGTVGRIYIGTDNNTISYDTGSSWTTITSGTGFTGSLSGDVMGSQSATVVSKVGGVTAANVASGANAANAATNANSASSIVARDASGNFAAGAVSEGSSIYRDSASNTVTVASPSTVTTSYSLTLPPAAPSTSGQILSATTAGVLSWINAAVGTITGVTAGTGLTGGGTSGTVTLGLATAGTVGTYTKVTTDAYGRVTAGATLSVSDIPSLPWSQITSGTPTTLAGYGITNGMANAGNSVSFQTGLASARPAFGTVGRYFVATDTNVIFYDTGSAWQTIVSGAGFTGSLSGDVTGTQSATVVSQVGGVTAANVAAGATLANAATNLNTASAIVKRDPSGNFAAGAVSEGSSIYRDSASNSVTLSAPSTVTNSYGLTLPAAAPSANGQILSATTAGILSWASPSSVFSTSVTAPITNSGSATAPNIGITQATTSASGYLSSTDWTTFNAKLSSALNSAYLFIGNASNVATGIALSGDATLTNAGALTVTGIKGKTVSAAPTTAGQVLRYDGTNITPNFLSMADLRSTVTGSSALNTGCTAAQTLTWNSGTDNLMCQSISIAAASQVSGVLPVANGGTGASSTSQNFVFAGPVGAAGAPSFRALTAADLPASASFWSAATGGINYANGSVGIGTTAPATLLDVIQSSDSSGGGIRVRNSAASRAGFLWVDSSATTHLDSGSTGNAPLVLNAGGGSVGIGTTAPIVPLDVVGSALHVAGGTTPTLSNQGAYLGWNTLTGSIGETDFINNPGVGPGGFAFTLSNSAGTSKTTPMFINGSGSVGIGTTAPTNNLDVAGMERIRSGGISKLGTASASDLGLYSEGASNYIRAVTNAGDIRFYVDGSSGNSYAGTNPSFVVSSGGNVGIGTTAPATSLDVSGAESHRGIATASAPAVSPAGQGRFYFDSTLNQYMFSQNGGAYAALATTGGTGSQTFAGDVNMNGAGTGLSVTNAATVGTTLGVTGLSTLTGGFTSAGIGNVTNSTASTSSTTGAMKVAGGLGVAGDIFAGATVNAATSMSSPQIYGSSAASGTLKLDGTSNATKGYLLLNSAGGNVGIGTTSPVDLLTLGASAGSATARQGIRVFENGYAAPSADNANSNGDKLITWNQANLKVGMGLEANGLWLQSNGQSGAHLAFYTGPTAGIAPIDRLHIDSAGNVGMGTTGPTYPLDVQAASTVYLVSATNNSTDATAINIGNTSAGRNWGLAVGGTSNAVGLSTGKFSIFDRNAGTSRLTIDTSGNVGIGTTSPIDILEVHRTTNENFAVRDANTALGTSGLTGIALQSVNDANTANQFLGLSGSTISLMGGNVGVGTTSPGQTLSVVGTGSFTSNLYVNSNGTGTGAGSSGTIQIGDGTIGKAYGSGFVAASNFSAQSFTATLATSYNTFAGNVGIGTTNPSYTLHVVGTAGLSTGTAWTNASDIRLKDIHGDYEYGLGEVLKLHTVRYNYKKKNALNLPSNKPMTGFIAQEVQKVIPDAVHKREDGYLELNVDPIHWAVVNAVQQLYHRWFDRDQEIRRDVASLRAENERLKAKTEALEKAVCELNPKAKICLGAEK